jgi:uncharacterized protein (TIGR00369 family)
MVPGGKELHRMNVWHGEVDMADLNTRGAQSLNSNLGIEIIGVTDSTLHGRMPVDSRTVQPAGALHGGASVALAETLASWAGALAVDPERFHVLGQEINANHIRPASTGWVHGTASPVHVGRRAHVWEVRITDDDGALVCISRCTLAVLNAPNSYKVPEQRG